MSRMVHYERVVGAGASPERWLLMLHGVFGTGRNWSHVAKQVAARRPDWGVALVDLPGHGKSAAVEAQTLDEAADAVLRMVEAEGMAAKGILGHSFGGKVALCYAEAADGLEQAWIADASPASSEPTGHGWGMIETLRRLPDTFENREAAVQALMEAGHGEAVARWMAMNVVRRGGAYRWRFDVDRMERLLRDFYATDFWNVVEQDTDGLRLEFVKAEGSQVLSAAACGRIAEAAASNSRIHLHQVPGGHWINIDSPAAVVDLLAERLVW